MPRISKVALVVVMAALSCALGVVGPSPAAGSCVGPHLAVGSQGAESPPTSAAAIGRGQKVIVSGHGFHSGCEDTVAMGPGCSGASAPSDPEAPLKGVVLVLRQGSNDWEVGTADADENYTISWDAEIPPQVLPGPAELRAETASLSVVVDP